MGPQSYTKNHRQLRSADSGRNSLNQGRALQLSIQYQMVSPGNIHSVTYRLSRLCLCVRNIYVTIINEK